MKAYTLLFLLIALTFTSCLKKYKVKGSVHISGKVTDQVSGAPVSNVSFKLYEVKKGSSMSKPYLFHVGSSDYTYSIDASGNYELNFSTSQTVNYGYAIEWIPANDTQYFYKFDNHYIDGSIPSYCQSRITKNETVLDIPLYRNSFHKARLVDDIPYNSSDTIMWTSAGVNRSIKNYSHDTTIFTTLPPSSTIQYYLKKWQAGKYTTLMIDTIYTTTSGDTIPTETHY